jgi:hypothetical protein
MKSKLRFGTMRGMELEFGIGIGDPGGDDVIRK